MKKTFKEITKNCDMVLFNNIVNVDNELELENGSELQKYCEVYTKEQFEEAKENGEIEKDVNFEDRDPENYKDIYQYFAINKGEGEYISEKCDMPLYYSEKCDIFILGVDFLDNWENLSFEV